MAESTPSGNNIGEDIDRSFEGFEEEDEKEENMEITGEGGRRRIFSKELRCMLYGYGDDK